MTSIQEPIELTKEEFIMRVNLCTHEEDIKAIKIQHERINSFVETASPLLEYVQAEIKRNERRTKMYNRIIEHVLGASAISAFGFIGHWLISMVKFKYFTDN